MRARRFSASLAATSLLLVTAPAPAQDVVDPSAGPAAIVNLAEAAGVATILDDLEAKAPSRNILIRDVRVVDPAAGTVSPLGSVLVRNGRIDRVQMGKWRGSTASTVVIDGRGRYLAPGLVDSHFHTSSTASALLNLANGVTSVREMAGFPWMLQMRANVHDRTMLAPTPYVAGTIINAFPLDGYAIVARTPDEARTIVRAQAACGYDFIKVHNRLRPDVIAAVAAEAKAVDRDLVGHVPKDITVRRAAELGMRTMEHLKGWLNDSTLQLGDRDYRVVSDVDSLWVTPTLYSTQDSLRGTAAQAALASPALAYVAPARRAAWRAIADEPSSPVVKLRQEQRETMVTIVHALHEAGARFLAGTDADGYPFTIAGFGLIDELRLLVGAGLTPPEALRAATSEPAKAFRRADEFGLVRPGLRADLVLLPRNPLADPAAYLDNHGVMANGRWLSRPALTRALDRAARLFAETAPATSPRHLLGQVERLARRGFVFDSASLANAATALRKTRQIAVAEGLQRIADRGARCPSH